MGRLTFWRESGIKSVPVDFDDRRTFWHSDAIDAPYTPDNDAEIRERLRPHDPGANLVSSLLTDGSHAPALDMDLPCTLIPSSTEGHYHLLIDKPMSWRRYRRLLRALVRAGIIERRCYVHSVKRKQTFLRLPHVTKGNGYASDL